MTKLICLLALGMTMNLASALELEEQVTTIQNDLENTSEVNLSEAALRTADEIQAGADSLPKNKEEQQYATQMNVIANKMRLDALQPGFKEKVQARFNEFANQVRTSAPRDTVGCGGTYAYTISNRMSLSNGQWTAVATAAAPAVFLIYVLSETSVYVDGWVAITVVGSIGVAFGTYGILKLYNRIKSRHDRDALAILDQAYAVASGLIENPWVTQDNLRRLSLRIDAIKNGYTINQVAAAVVGANEAMEFCPSGQRPLIKGQFRDKVREWLKKQ